MNDHFCNVCGNKLEEKLYNAPANKSLTSLSVLADQPTDVYFCHQCQHVQTAEYGNESTYYDVSYNILTNSEDEDQIYIVEDGKPVYRTDHQVNNLLSKIDLFENIKILDYGCAKSSTMAKLLKTRSNLDVYLYDVSANYAPFWNKFLDKSKYSTYVIPDDWIGKFDLVTSFFSLEHITNLREVVHKIKSLLKEGGTFYAVVPNFLTNIADMIVIDHPNHFTESSIYQLLSDNDFVVESIDSETHRGAFVIKAKLDSIAPKVIRQNTFYEMATAVAKFWTESSKKIAKYESENKTSNAAIYGAGFYGAFLAANINNFSSVKFIIDQSPHLQGKLIFNREVIPPNKLPKEIDVIYVGLNPMYAKSIIESTALKSMSHLKYFYL